MENIINDLKKLKEEIESAKVEKIQKETEINLLKEELKQLIGTSDLTKAKKALDRMTKDKEEKEEIIKEKYNSLKEMYEW